MVSVARVKPRSVLIREARARRALIARVARTDINTFCEFVLKDEKDGSSIVQAGPHAKWQQLAEETIREEINRG